MNVVPSSKLFPAAESPWNQVVLLYRRICVLRAQEQSTQAEALRVGEFSRVLALAEAQAIAAGENEISTRLQSVFTAEEERVANASVLASLLAPVLEELLRPVILASSAAPRLEKDIASNAAELPTSPPTNGSRPPLSVADFIEGMLLQEKSAQRRAS